MVSPTVIENDTGVKKSSPTFTFTTVALVFINKAKTRSKDSFFIRTPVLINIFEKWNK
jgi:hypothetical protein